MSIKICFIAPSEYGKNTAIKILKTKYKIFNIKIAEPLYKLQSYFYDFIGSKMVGEQDGQLLQYLGQKVRKENKNFLLDEFNKKFCPIEKSDIIITNDDCRPPDYQFFKEHGFIFIKINGFKRNRVDHTKSNPLSSLEWQAEMPCDYVVDNLDSIDDYKNNLFQLMKNILKDKEIIYEK